MGRTVRGWSFIKSRLDKEAGLSGQPWDSYDGSYGSAMKSIPFDEPHEIIKYTWKLDAGTKKTLETAFKDNRRFWSKVLRGDPKECWPWTGGNGRNGRPSKKDGANYGYYNWGPKNYPASRFAWKATYGEPAEGLFVLHKCDNPPCCNPTHLFLGTPLDNVKDMVAKGRVMSGEQWKAHRAVAKVIRRIKEARGK